MFAVPFDPRLSYISKILKKHYGIVGLVSLGVTGRDDISLRLLLEIRRKIRNSKETFPDLTLVVYRRYKNLRRYLTRAKLYLKIRPDLRTHSKKLRKKFRNKKKIEFKARLSDANK